MDFNKFVKKKSLSDMWKIHGSVLYVVRMKKQPRLGLHPKFLKIGVAKRNVIARLKMYLTYYLQLEVLFLAMVGQSPLSDKSTLLGVESQIKRHMKGSVEFTQIRKTESFVISRNSLPAALKAIQTSLQNNEHVFFLQRFRPRSFTTLTVHTRAKEEPKPEHHYNLRRRKPRTQFSTYTTTY